MAKFVRCTAGLEKIVVWVNLDMVRSMYTTANGTRMRLSPVENDVIYVIERPEQLLGIPSEGEPSEAGVETLVDLPSAL